MTDEPTPLETSPAQEAPQEEAIPVGKELEPKAGSAGEEQEPEAKPGAEEPRAESEETERDAIILMAGLGVVDVGGWVDETARRVATALDNEAPAEAQFVLEEGRDEDYGRSSGVDGRTRRVTVSCKDRPASEKKPLADLYSLDYRQTLMVGLPQERPLTLLRKILFALLSNGRRLLLSLGSPGKTSAEKWQVRIAWLMFLSLALYAVIVLGAAVGTFLPDELAQDTGPEVQEQVAGEEEPLAGEGPPGEGESPAEQELRGTEEQRARQLQENLLGRLKARTGRYLVSLAKLCALIVVWITALGLLLKTDLKAQIEKSGIETVVATDYLATGTRRDSAANQFSALLNHIGEKDDVNYRNVYVVAYSFGSIAALDALYPHGAPLGVFKMIKGLVTIGCPFDFIRTYWPDYFDDRSADGSDRWWLNIYAPADVLSSDFKDHSSRGDTAEDAGIALADGKTLLRPGRSAVYGDPKPLDEYGRIERWGLIGFRVHTRYWEAGSAGCYRYVVRWLFPERTGSRDLVLREERE